MCLDLCHKIGGEKIPEWTRKKKVTSAMDTATKAMLEASYRVQKHLIEFPFSTLRRFLGMTSTNFPGEYIFFFWFLAC